MQAGKSTGGGAETGNFENLSKLREKAFAVRTKTTKVLPFPSRWSLCETNRRGSCRTTTQNKIGALEKHMGESHKVLAKVGAGRAVFRLCTQQIKGECSYKRQIYIDFEKYRGREKRSLVLQTHLLAPADMRDWDFAAKSSMLYWSNLLCLQMNQFDFMKDRL